MSNEVEKNPWIAFILSILFAGLGHIYVGPRNLGMKYLLGGISLIFLFFGVIGGAIGWSASGAIIMAFAYDAYTKAIAHNNKKLS